MHIIAWCVLNPAQHKSCAVRWLSWRAHVAWGRRQSKRPAGWLTGEKVSKAGGISARKCCRAIAQNGEGRFEKPHDLQFHLLSFSRYDTHAPPFPNQRKSTRSSHRSSSSSSVSYTSPPPSTLSLTSLQDSSPPPRLTRDPSLRPLAFWQRGSSHASLSERTSSIPLPHSPENE